MWGYDVGGNDQVGTSENLLLYESSKNFGGESHINFENTEN